MPDVPSPPGAGPPGAGPRPGGDPPTGGRSQPVTTWRLAGPPAAAASPPPGAGPPGAGPGGEPPQTPLHDAGPRDASPHDAGPRDASPRDASPRDASPGGQPPQTPLLTRRARLWQSAESRGVPLRTILTAVTVVALFYLAGKVVYRLRDVILLMVTAAFLTVLLNPLVVALQGWRIRRRGLAVTVVVVWGLLVFFGLAILFGYPLANGITHLAHDLPSYVSSVEHGQGWLGHLAQRYHIQAWVQHNAPKLVNLGQGLAKPALSLGKGAITIMLALLTIFVLVILLLLEGPKMRAAVLRMMVPERAERYARVAWEVNRSVAGYMLGNFLTSIIAGIVVLVTLLAAGVPFPFLWALWVALVDFLPMIGGALAGIPTILFALGHSLLAGIVTLVVFLVYTQIENHILNPIVMSRTVRVNPLLVLISILVGATIGGWIGGVFGGFVVALIAIPAAGAVQVVAREIWVSTAPGAPAPGAPARPGGAPAPPGGAPARPGLPARPDPPDPPAAPAAPE